MNIGMIGAGNIGQTLGEKWKAAGHTVTYGVRDPAAKAHLGTVGTVRDAAQRAEVVLFAIPSRSMPQVVQDLATVLDHKILIDATNNVGAEVMHQLPLLQGIAPHAHIYRAFSNLGWENFADPLIDRTQLDLLYCGHDARRPMTASLIADIGLNPVYIGDLKRADIIDATTRLWFTLAIEQNRGRHLGFKILVD